MTADAAFAFLAKQTMGLATEPAFDHSLRFSPDQLLSDWGGNSFTYLCATNRLSVWTFLSESSGSPCSWLSEMSSDTSECCMKLERGGREREKGKWSALQNWNIFLFFYYFWKSFSFFGTKAKSTEITRKFSGSGGKHDLLKFYCCLLLHDNSSDKWDLF